MAFVWEQRKLGEVAKYRNGKAHENCIDDDGKYIVVNSKFVSTNGKVKKFSNMQNEPLFENEVAFVLSDVPNGRAIARTFLVEKSDKYTLNQRIAGITPLNETDPYYLHVLMNRHPYFLAFDDGVKQTNLSVSDVMKFESYYPKYEEQETIGRCFSQLDQLITLHQRKRMLRRCFFSIDWEQRKVSEIADRFDNLRVPVAANLRTPGTTPYYGANGIQDYVEGYTHDGEFVLVAEDGANDLKNYPVKCVNGRIWVNNHAHVLQARPQIASNQFLAYSMSQANIEALLVGGGRAKLNAEVMMGIVLRIPRLQEQEVIGGYFYKLDQLITLHQCKSNFCKKNEVNAWEQRKLGDLVERITKKNQDLLSELPLTISAQYGLIDQKEFFDKRVASKDISGYYLIKNGEFAYNKSTSTDAPWGAIKRLDRYETGVLSTLYIVFGIKKDTELNSNFLTAYYSTNLWHKEIHEIAAEGARNHGLLNISPADFFKTKLSTPQDLKEQNKIGNYFIQLDQLITLHQWECNINENTEGNDEKQRKPIKKLIISEGNLSLVDDMFLLHRMTFLVCNKYILLRLNVVKYKITIIIISNILYSIVSLLIIACYLIVINKQLIILIYVEISVVIIKGDDDYARIRS